MSCHNMDFATLNLAGELFRRGSIDDPLTKGRDHGAGVGLIDAEFAGDLQSGDVQPHEHPGSRGG